LLALSACAPDHGVVHNKHYSPPYQYTTMQCYSYNSKGFCTVNMPVIHTQPAEYEFDLYNGKDHGWRDVDPDSYQRYKIGDEYP
jgi:hypothetical protein